MNFICHLRGLEIKKQSLARLLQIVTPSLNKLNIHGIDGLQYSRKRDENGENSLRFKNGNFC